MSTTTFFIGVSGHQNLGDEVTQRFVVHQFREVLRTYQQREHNVTLYSALAKGADQMFVQIALELGVAVEIVLPCAEYETLFPSEEEREVYRQLLHSHQALHQLPFRDCSEDAFLAAGQWIVDHCSLLILAWNGLVPQGRGGTGDVASYARSTGCPFIHINTRQREVTIYPGNPSRDAALRTLSAKEASTITKQRIYQGAVLTLNHYHVRMSNGEEIVRDVVERPESVLILPVGPKDIVLLIEEYDFAIGTWQLTLPGGKVEDALHDKLKEQAQKELRQETGYRAESIEKILDFHSHPGYVSHHVHAFVASDLEWNPLPIEAHEAIRVRTYTLQEALTETFKDNRCDPEAALVLWLYAQKRGKSSIWK